MTRVCLLLAALVASFSLLSVSALAMPAPRVVRVTKASAKTRDWTTVVVVKNIPIITRHHSCTVTVKTRGADELDVSVNSGEGQAPEFQQMTGPSNSWEFGCPSYADSTGETLTLTVNAWHKLPNGSFVTSQRRLMVKVK